MSIRAAAEACHGILLAVLDDRYERAMAARELVRLLKGAA